jgi:hypothetical protein
MRWTGHVARIGEGREVYRGSVRNPEGKGPLGHSDVDRRIIIRWIFKK